MTEMDPELIRLAKEYFKKTKRSGGLHYLREETLKEVAEEKHPNGVFIIIRDAQRKWINDEKGTYGWEGHYETISTEFNSLNYRKCSRYTKGFSVVRKYANHSLFDVRDYAQSGRGLVTSYDTWERFLVACEKYEVPKEALELFKTQCVINEVLPDDEPLVGINT